MITLHDILTAIPLPKGRFYFELPTAKTRDNWYNQKENFTPVEERLSLGKDWLVGKEPSMSDYLRKHTSYLNAWQKLAYQFCLENRDLCLTVKLSRNEWEISYAGEKNAIIFALPYHDQGGEKHWLSLDGKKKILFNID